MSSSTTKQIVDGQRAESSASGVPPRRQRAGAEDWLTSAVVFAILGGCAALWLFGLSPVIGTAAAVLSAIAGILFADA